MSSPSNLYAEKVFAEHPSILYSLDDVADYISLINEEDRDLSAWTITDGIAALDNSVSDEPFIDSFVTKITGDVPSGQTEELSLVSPDIINFNSLNSDFATFSVGAYFYAKSSYLSKITVGYEYTDPDTLDVKQFTKSFEIDLSGVWLFASETFEFPNVDAQIRLVLKIEYFEGGVNEQDYEFFINGVSAGQWSEEFQSSSLGSTVVSIPENIAVDAELGVRAEAYGLQDFPGYYLIENNSLAAKNTGMPIVYGASGITKISSATGPSLIIPGLGFLNSSGKYKDYTLEFWLRIDAETKEPKKIFGPVSSDDGLYVDGPFLKLKINDFVESHYVGEWYRPMFLQIRYISDTVTMLVNGEDAISLNVKTQDLVFPDKNDEFDRDQDWLGFYSHENIYEYEIDGVAIYEYQVPAVVGKRRWVYGQGVEYPENINLAYSGQSVLIDYPFAKYTNNYNYPDIGKWDNGITDNLLTNEIFLGTPNYSLPQAFFDSRESLDWQEALSEFQEDEDLFITLSPGEEWEDTQGHLLFDNLNFLKDGADSFYGVFKEIPEITEEKQILFLIKDKTANNYFEISLLNGEISYKIFYEGTTEILKEESGITTTNKFVAGIDIQKISSSFGKNVSAFFGNLDGLSLYVGGSFDFANTFVGNIYDISFSNKRNRLSLDFDFEDGIILNAEDVNDFISHKSSYKLHLKNIFNTYKVAFDTHSYWQDYLPLSYFAKFTEDISGEKTYQLDFLQFNIDYPTIASKNIEDPNFYDTSDQSVKAYVTFQLTNDGANKDIKDFVNTQYLSVGGFIEPGTEWQNTKYEVSEGTVIYPPKNISFSRLGICLHLEITTKNAVTDKIKIRRIQLASQALSNTGSNPVSTRFGNDLFPYTKLGFYFDYKARNPFRIYKDSSPYLYMTKSSGIRILGKQESLVSRGISLPLNKNLVPQYKIIAMQAGLYFDQDAFPDTPVEIMEVQGKTSYIKFFAESVHPEGKRAKIYAVDATTGIVQNGITFFWNGKLVRNPIVTAKEWGMLGLSFGERINLDGFLGALRITGPFLINNISHYESTNLQEIQQITTRTWQKVKTLNFVDLFWSYWSPDFTWNEVLVTAPRIFLGIDPASIYATFTGTNKIIVDDDRALMVKDYEYNSYNSVISETRIVPAV